MDSKEIVYSAQPDGFDPDYRYAHPGYFSVPRRGVTRVYIVGNWPRVAEAYRKGGVEVIEGHPSGRRPAATINAAPQQDLPESVDMPEHPEAAVQEDAPVQPEPAPEPAPEPVAEQDAEGEPETELAVTGTAEPRDQQAAVDIPDDWARLSWPEMRSLAASVSDDPILNGDQAKEAIETELVRRADG